MPWLSALPYNAVAKAYSCASPLLPRALCPAGESLLEEAIALAAGNGLVKPHDHVVAVSLSSHREAMVKVSTRSSGVAGGKVLKLDVCWGGGKKEVRALQPHLHSSSLSL